MLALLTALLLDTATACPRGTLPAYAHNDYANARPLHDALALGYRGVEADVALIDGILRLGHSRHEARSGPTLEQTYLAPLADLVTRCGRLTADGAPFLLAVELKSHDPASADSLAALLARYRPRFGNPGPDRDVPVIDVVLVGWTPPGRATDGAGVQHRLHHPTDVSAADAWPASVRLVSVDYGKTMGRPWRTPAGRRRWLEALRAAARATAAHRGAEGALALPVTSEPATRRAARMRIRVHNVPVRAAVYRELLAAGVDLIGTKDLAGTARVLATITR